MTDAEKCTHGLWQRLGFFDGKELWKCRDCGIERCTPEGSGQPRITRYDWRTGETSGADPFVRNNDDRR